MKRELYIYWRLAPADLAPAQAAMRSCQAALRLAHPGLQARLLCRQEEGDKPATLMETYAMPGGLPLARQSDIVAQGAQAAAAWCQGTRHIEVFEPVLA